MSVSLFAVAAVVRRTGLSAHTLRAWEKRYGAVRPNRSRTGQRRYSQKQVERLLLLQRATQSGHAIGTVVNHSNADLRRLLRVEKTSVGVGQALRSVEDELRADCIAGVRAMDEPAVATALEKALLRLGEQGLLRRVLAPLAEEIGELWRAGQIRAAHEHFFTAVARTFVGGIAQQFAIPADAPALIAATPAGQHHELGAFMAAVAAIHLGWRAIYLGPSLPAAEIASAVLQVDAPVLILSIIYPTDDPRLPNELRAIRKRLPETNLIVGGRAARSYLAVLRTIKADMVTGIDKLSEKLDSIRAMAAGRSRLGR